MLIPGVIECQSTHRAPELETGHRALRDLVGARQREWAASIALQHPTSARAGSIRRPCGRTRVTVDGAAIASRKVWPEPRVRRPASAGADPARRLFVVSGFLWPRIRDADGGEKLYTLTR